MADRMRQIRYEFIEPIRRSYNRDLFIENMVFFKAYFNDTRLNHYIDRVTYSYWDHQVDNAKTFSLIKMLTTEKASSTIGKTIGDILRVKELPREDLVRFAVVLVEAVNIELFLYTQLHPRLQNFQGKVYRGITTSLEDYLKFNKLMEESVLENRVISVPLSLWSSSKDIGIAEGFLKYREDSNRNVFLMLAVNVINLAEDDLNLYRQQFPSSVVSSICAVDISQISELPEEEEVLLRGAFCLVLDIKENQPFRSKPQLRYHLIDCVMVNSNRDHISTNSLGDKADSARELFANINKKARFAFATQYYQRNREEGSRQQDFRQREEHFHQKTQEEVEKIMKRRRELESTLASTA